MYNEERKISYLKSLEGERTDDYLQTVVSVFNKTEPYEEMYEKEYLDQLRTRILNFAKEVNFTVDPELLETVMFEAYSRDMDLDQAFKAVWKAVYVEDGANTTVEIE